MAEYDARENEGVGEREGGNPAFQVAALAVPGLENASRKHHSGRHWNGCEQNRGRDCKLTFCDTLRTNEHAHDSKNHACGGGGEKGYERAAREGTPERGKGTGKEVSDEFEDSAEDYLEDEFQNEAKDLVEDGQRAQTSQIVAASRTGRSAAANTVAEGRYGTQG